MNNSQKRSQRTYDHRLRELVRVTQDPDIVAEFGVPRSTALGWLCGDYQPVVTDTLLDKDIVQLQAEILKLRRHVSILSAIIRLLRILLHVFDIRLDRKRLPEGVTKAKIVSTVFVLKDTVRIATTDEQTPAVVTDGGVENINREVDGLIESGLLRRVVALKEIMFSNSLIEAWWRVLKHQWLYLNTLDSIGAVRKLVSFYVAEYNATIPHSAFEGLTPDETYWRTGSEIPTQLAQATLSARQARRENNRALSCDQCRTNGKSVHTELLPMPP